MNGYVVFVPMCAGVCVVAHTNRSEELLPVSLIQFPPHFSEADSLTESHNNGVVDSQQASVIILSQLSAVFRLQTYSAMLRFLSQGLGFYLRFP